MTEEFDHKLQEIMESMEIINENKYAKWVDQKGREVYPKILSMKEMKRVIPRKLGFFQKRGKVYSLPLIPTKGKIQKEFRKHYRRSFAPRPRG